STSPRLSPSRARARSVASGFTCTRLNFRSRTKRLNVREKPSCAILLKRLNSQMVPAWVCVVAKLNRLTNVRAKIELKQVYFRSLVMQLREVAILKPKRSYRDSKFHRDRRPS